MRVIAGRARGTKLISPEGLETRPTSDRIKESLFNIIAPDLYDCLFLDLFSGSGGIGIEALSRGAKEAVFVEISKNAFKCIKTNIEKTKFTNESIILNTTIDSALSQLGKENKKFHIIFMDPPYNKDVINDTIKLILNCGLLAPNGYIIVERNSLYTMTYDKTLTLWKEKEIWGDYNKFPERNGIDVKIGIYPGSFDPVTNGHMDIIRRSAKLVDTLIVAILHNSNKKALFSAQERIELLEESCKDIKNLHVESFSGLLIDFAKQKKANLIIRGLRALTDFEYELQMAQMNKHLDSEIETIFLVTDTKYSFLSSSTIKEIAKFGGDVSDFVPPIVSKKTLQNIREE